MRVKAEEDSKRIKEFTEQQQKSIEEQKERLEKIQSEVERSGYLSTSEIDDIATKVVDKM